MSDYRVGVYGRSDRRLRRELVPDEGGAFDFSSVREDEMVVGFGADGRVLPAPSLFAPPSVTDELFRWSR